MTASTTLPIAGGLIEIAGELAGDAREANDRQWLNVTVTRLDGNRRHPVGATLFPLGLAGGEPAGRPLPCAVMPERLAEQAAPRRAVYRINGRRTTLKLETVFAEGLQEIADAQQTTVNDLLSQIEREHVSGGEPFNLTSAVRVFVACHHRAHRRPLPRAIEQAA